MEIDSHENTKAKAFNVEDHQGKSNLKKTGVGKGRVCG